MSTGACARLAEIPHFDCHTVHNIPYTWLSDNDLASLTYYFVDRKKERREKIRVLKYRNFDYSYIQDSLTLKSDIQSVIH